jgi:hypothetical protein
MEQPQGALHGQLPIQIVHPYTLVILTTLYTRVPYSLDIGLNSLTTS